MVPPAMLTHLEWVPGMTATPSKPGSPSMRPTICVSSPRITSPSRSGLLSMTPGTMAIGRPSVESKRTIASANASVAAGQGR